MLAMKWSLKYKRKYIKDPKSENQTVDTPVY